MADRALTAAAVTLAVLMPLVLGLAVALVQPSGVLAVLVLLGFWAVGIGLVCLFFSLSIRRTSQ